MLPHFEKKLRGFSTLFFMSKKVVYTFSSPNIFWLGGGVITPPAPTPELEQCLKLAGICMIGPISTNICMYDP